MPFSRVNFTYTGGPQVFPTNFALGVLEEDHVTVTVNGQLDGLGNLRPFAHTYDAGTGEVTVTEPLTIGWTGSIFRTVPLDTLIVDFEANADVTKRNLSRSSKQVLMAVQEARDERAADSLAINEAVDAVEALQASIAADVATVEAGAAAVEAALVVVGNAEDILVDAEAATAALTAGLADINSRASKAANLSDLTDISTAQTNFGMSAFFKTLLSWVDAAAARTALGLGALAQSSSVLFSNIAAAAVRLSSEGITTPTDTELSTTLWVKTYADSIAHAIAQTWQDMTASRAFGTSYQNLTGKPISVVVRATNIGGAIVTGEVSINNSTWTVVDKYSHNVGSTFTDHHQVAFVVPPGQYYRSVYVSGNATLTTWMELR